MDLPEERKASAAESEAEREGIALGQMERQRRDARDQEH